MAYVFLLTSSYTRTLCQIFSLDLHVVGLASPFTCWRKDRTTRVIHIPVTCPGFFLKRTLDQSCDVSPDCSCMVLSPLFPMHSPPDLLRCRFLETLLVATACSCCFLFQVWQTWACFLPLCSVHAVIKVLPDEWVCSRNCLRHSFVAPPEWRESISDLSTAGISGKVSETWIYKVQRVQSRTWLRVYTNLN